MKAKVSILVICLAIALLVPWQPSVTASPTPEPYKSDITVEWDFDEKVFKYHYKGTQEYDLDDIVVMISDTTLSVDETLTHSEGELEKEDTEITGISSFEPVDGHNYSVVFRHKDLILAERSILTSANDFIYSEMTSEYNVKYHMVEVDGSETTTMDMDVVASIESKSNYEKMRLSGDVEMVMDSDDGDETLLFELEGEIEGAETKVDGKITESFMDMNMKGSFDMESGSMTMDGEMEMGTREENNLKVSSSMKMDGDWTSMGRKGTIFQEENTLRIEDHINRDGTNYNCLVQHGYFRMTDTGEELENTTTSWEVRESGYDNEVIYFEYEEKENGVTTETGSCYPEDSPIPEEEEIDIMDVSTTEGVGPSNMVVGDVVIESSETNVKFAIRYEVTGTGVKTIGNQDFNCYRISGVVSKGGSGTVEGYMCYDPDYDGVMVYLKEDYRWGPQQLETSFELKMFSGEKEDDSILPIESELLVPVIGGGILLIGLLGYVLLKKKDKSESRVGPAPGSVPVQALQYQQPQPFQQTGFQPQQHSPYVQPPLTPQAPQYNCPLCRNSLQFVPQHQRYYCWSCQRYV